MADTSASRIVGVFLSPAKTFQAIAERPTWALALALMLLIGAINGSIMTRRLDFEAITRHSFAEKSITPDEAKIEQAVAMQEKLAPIFGVVNPVLFGAAFFFVGALIFAVVFRLLGGELSYKSSLATYVHGFLPTAVAGLLNLPVILRRETLQMDEVMGGGNFLASNLGFLASEDTAPTIKALLGSVDAFSLWVIVLLAIGYSTAAGTSRRSAAIGVVILWLVAIGIKVGLVALTS
jgi:Yip1 domain